MRSDQPPPEIERVVQQSSTFVVDDDIEQAGIYLGLIEGAPGRECLRNFLAAIGRGIPIMIVTSAVRPCPAWMIAQTDRTVIIGPGVSLTVAAHALASWAEWFFKRHPHLAKRRRN